MRAMLLRLAAVVVLVGATTISIVMGPVCVRYAESFVGTAYCSVADSRIPLRLAIGVGGALAALLLVALSYPTGAPRPHPKAALWRWLS